MDDIKKLRQVVETNFRLNILQTRELSLEMNSRFGEVNQHLGRITDGLTQVSGELAQMGQTFMTSLDEQANRSEETLAALRVIIDNSVKQHKKLEDHEQRIRRLEERAS